MSSDLSDLEMAKKRDHKIIITDEAINKVPLVQYKEIPETEYDNPRELARQVLQLSTDDHDHRKGARTYSLESAQLIEKPPLLQKQSNTLPFAYLRAASRFSFWSRK